MLSFNQSIAARIRSNDVNKTSLGLQLRDIDDKEATVLVLALSENCTLTALRLWGNSIGDEGAQAITSAL